MCLTLIELRTKKKVKREEGKSGFSQWDMLLLLLLPSIILAAPRNGGSRDDREFLPSSPSLPTNESPVSSLNELETKLTDKMRVMYSILSSRLDKLEGAVHDVQHSTEKGEWLVRDDQSSYRLHEERRKWKEAQSICQSQGASLVTVDSVEENGFVTQIVKMKPHIDFVWLKMKNRPQVTPLDVKYSNITQTDEHRQCTVLCSDSSWALRSCDQLRPFICKRDPPAPESRINSDEEEVANESPVHPTLHQPIQPWKNEMRDSSSREETNVSHASERSHDGRNSNGTPKRALDFLFQ